MVTLSHGTPAQLKTRGAKWCRRTLQQVVDMELQKMEDCGWISYWNKDDEGRVNQDKLHAFFRSEEEDQAWDQYLQCHVLLNTGLYGLLMQGRYALQLQLWFRAFDQEQFMVLKLESSKTTGVQAIMSQVWAHLDLPNHSVHNETPKNTRDYQPMESDVKEYLEQFFELHNCRLAQVLCTEEEDWNCPWPCI
jgi:hypothetical protein